MRELFLLDPAVVFLNQGSFGACPRDAFDDHQRWHREMERNPVEFLGRRSASLLQDSRERLARIVGAQPQHLVSTSPMRQPGSTSSRDRFPWRLATTC